MNFYYIYLMKKNRVNTTKKSVSIQISPLIEAKKETTVCDLDP